MDGTCVYRAGMEPRSFWWRVLRLVCLLSCVPGSAGLQPEHRPCTTTPPTSFSAEKETVFTRPPEVFQGATIPTLVTSEAYDTAQLPCHFPFIHGVERLIIVWVKKEDDGQQLVVHKFMNGQDDFSMQDPQYTGRTTLSEDLSHGNLTLTLTCVTLRDGGTYYCRAFDGENYDYKRVTLSVDWLSVDWPVSRAGLFHSFLSWNFLYIVFIVLLLSL